MKIRSLFFLLLLIPVIGFTQVFPSWYPKDGFDIGEIKSLSGSSRLSFDDRFFLISPTVKVSSITQKKASFSLIKPGVTVGLKMITFNKKVYIDHIYILPDTLK